MSDKGWSTTSWSRKSEKKIVVPEGMLRAAWHAQLPADNPTFEWDEGDEMNRKFYRRIVEAALRWLIENPIVPTHEQIDNMQFDSTQLRHVMHHIIEVAATEWQRRMFLAPEPEVPTFKELLAMFEKLTASFDPPLKRAPKPEVPEEVLKAAEITVAPKEDFGVFISGYNNAWSKYVGDDRNRHFTCMSAGLEAYRRGQKGVK